MHITAEQILIALNLFWLSGFTWFYQSSMKALRADMDEIKRAVHDCVGEKACAERMCNLKKSREDALQISEAKIKWAEEVAQSQLKVLENEMKNAKNNIEDLYEKYNGKKEKE